MTPQEREVIDSIFERLKPAASQPRDPEAERHIATLMQQQPYATYVLAQSAYVQEQAINNLAKENEQLKARVAEAEAKAAQPAPSGGFLSGLFGGGAPAPRPQAAPQPAPQGGPWGGQPGAMGMQAAPQAPQGGPWGGQAAQAQPQGGGSSFLGTALTTAAGVAGGMVVGNMLMNAFKGSGSGSSAHAADSSAMSSGASDFQPFPPSSGGEHIPASDNSGYGSDYGNGAQDVGYDDSGYDDGGGDYDV